MLTSLFLKSRICPKSTVKQYSIIDKFVCVPILEMIFIGHICMCYYMSVTSIPTVAGSLHNSLFIRYYTCSVCQERYSYYYFFGGGGGVPSKLYSSGLNGCLYAMCSPDVSTIEHFLCLIPAKFLRKRKKHVNVFP